MSRCDGRIDGCRELWLVVIAWLKLDVGMLWLILLLLLLLLYMLLRQVRVWCSLRGVWHLANNRGIHSLTRSDWKLMILLLLAWLLALLIVLLLLHVLTLLLLSRQATGCSQLLILRSFNRRIHCSCRILHRVYLSAGTSAQPLTSLYRSRHTLLS